MLMVASNLPEFGVPWHDQQRFARFLCAQDRTGTRVGYHLGAASEYLGVTIRRHVGLAVHVLGLIVTLRRLHNDLLTWMISSPSIHGPHQSVERQLSADCDENHSTPPAQWIPSSTANAGHCVRKRSQ